MPERKTIRLTNAEVGKVIGVRGAVVRTIRLQSGASVEIEHGAGDGATAGAQSCMCIIEPVAPNASATCAVTAAAQTTTQSPTDGD